MTGLLDAALALLIATIANSATLLQIRRRVAPTEVRFVSNVYLWTVLLRSSLAVVLNVFAADSSFALAFWGDSSAYDLGGYQLAQKWAGDPSLNAYMALAPSGYGWTYVVAFVYFLFGRNQLMVQFVNATVGGVTVLVIHAIAARLFGFAAARWAALLMAFFPQVVFWSAGMYKDPAILLCIATCMYAVLRLREHLSLPMVVLFVAAELTLMTLRFYVAYFVAFATIAALLSVEGRNLFRIVATYGVLLAALLGAMNFAIARDTLEVQASYLTLERLQTTRDDQATWGQSGFGREYNVSTPAGAVAALPVGIVYLLFAPFPWAVSGLRQALVLPETLVWYALMPAFARGLVFAMRQRFRAVLPIAVFALSLTTAYALMQGNVGTAYRQRTQITMFFFIFMAVGIVERRRSRARRVERGWETAST